MSSSACQIRLLRIAIAVMSARSANARVPISPYEHTRTAQRTSGNCCFGATIGAACHWFAAKQTRKLQNVERKPEQLEFPTERQRTDRCLLRVSQRLPGRLSSDRHRLRRLHQEILRGHQVLCREAFGREVVRQGC